LITITNEEFKKLAEYIRLNYGINLKEEKRALVTGRLQSVLIENGFTNFTDYYNYVIKDKTGNASTVLLNQITTNHTFFMREADHFYYFRDTVLPYLKATVSSKDLRIWSAGCSSGEEPYTLAMIMDEFFGKDKALWDTKILATDISNKVLEKAKKGEYNNKDLTQLPPSWRLNYFNKTDANVSSINDKIKKEVIFRRFNLMNPTFSFKRKFHVIFCRNVMIYFNSETRDELTSKFYDLTEPGGYLFIGHSETLNREKTKYKFIMPAVYRKE
jgi:chemotaxis protein methyltransferase CheR